VQLSQLSSGPSGAALQGPLGVGRLAAVPTRRVVPPQVSDGITVEGPLGAALRRAAYLYRQPTNEQRVSVATSWVAQAAEAAPKILQQILGAPRRA
jgi:hypothetical protein